MVFKSTSLIGIQHFALACWCCTWAVTRNLIKVTEGQSDITVENSIVKVLVDIQYNMNKQRVQRCQIWHHWTVFFLSSHADIRVLNALCKKSAYLLYSRPLYSSHIFSLPFSSFLCRVRLDLGPDGSILTTGIRRTSLTFTYKPMISSTWQPTWCLLTYCNAIPSVVEWRSANSPNETCSRVICHREYHFRSIQSG